MFKESVGPYSFAIMIMDRQVTFRVRRNHVRDGCTSGAGPVATSQNSIIYNDLIKVLSI